MDKNLGLLIVVGLLIWLLAKGQNGTRQVSNEETWTWVDYKGNPRSITVKRDVTAN